METASQIAAWTFGQSLMRRDPASAQRAYLEEIQPYVQIKARTMMLLPPRPILMHADGRLEVLEEPLPDGVQKVFDQIDELIQAIQLRYGICPTPPSP